ncbi:MAG: exonuclease SbcCD subunit D [Candidatus Thermoplasmatota archaeon]
MKILHVADTHLGYSAYRKVTSDGVNQREQDTYDSFKQFIDYALSSPPDLIIHAGDLFDSVRPNNRAITLAVQQILRLSKKNIPFVIIAGNHEHPKLRETGHIFSVFDHLDNVYPIYHDRYEKMDLTIKEKKVRLHLIPQCNSKEVFEEEIHKLKPDNSKDLNILMAHGAVKGIKAFSMNELNELMIPADYLSKDFDYIALGHYHTYTQLNNNSFYAGSTERFSFTEANEDKGFIEITVDEENKIDTNFVQLDTREMLDLPSIDCSDLKLEEVSKKISKQIEAAQPEDKIFRITLQNIPVHIYRGLDLSEIKKDAKQAVHHEIKADIIRDDGSKRHTDSAKIDLLSREFQRFIKNKEIKNKENLLKIGLKYIEKIEEKKQK